MTHRPSLPPLPTLTLQPFVWSKGDDRAIFRNFYVMPMRKGDNLFTATERHSEFLSPEAGSRGEYEPQRSYHTAINNVLDEMTMRCVVQLEAMLKTRVSYIALDYIITPSDQPLLVWPKDVRTLDIDANGKFVAPPPEPVKPAADTPPKKPKVEAPTPEEPDWVGAKARAFEKAQAEEAALASEFSALVGQTVGDGSRGRILLVDVEPASVVPAVRVLTSEGFAVTVCDDGPKAIALTRGKTFDCMLLARDLPSLSGIEVVKMLRTREASLVQSRPGVSGSNAYHLPIVAFTSSTSPADLNLYIEVGFDGCVSKPLDPHALISTMSAAVPAPPDIVSRNAGVAAKAEAEANLRRAQAQASVAPPLSRDSPPRGASQGSQLPPPSPMGGGGFAGFPVGAASQQSAPASPRGLQGIRGARSMAAARRSGAKSPTKAGIVSIGKDGSVKLPAGAAIPGVLPPVGPSLVDGNAPQAGVTAGLPVPEDSEDGSSLGIFQLDAETALPYCVMGKRRPGVPLFHFVVINDIFDTFESHQILFRKVVAALPGLRVLLFNCPGQAYTEWRRDIVLNNEYLAGVLQALMTYTGPGGTREFDLDGGIAPFHMLGIGNGGAIANYFAAAYAGSHPNMRSIVLINGFAHVDAHFAGVMHVRLRTLFCIETSVALITNAPPPPTPTAY